MPLPAGARGALWMLVTVGCFALMAIAARGLSAELSVAAIMFWRGLVGFLIMLPIALATNRPSALITRRPFGHATRNLVHFLGQYGWFYGIVFLPLAQVTALISTVPIMGAILAALFLGEKVGRARAALIGVGFVGVLAILRPGLIPIEIASFVVIGAAGCYAASSIMVKSFTRTESAAVITLYMMLMQTPMALVPAIWGWSWPGLEDIPAIVVVGATGLLAHFAMARGLAIADASVVLPVGYLQLPIMAVIGYLLYMEHPDAWTLAGGALILASNWYNVQREQWAARRKGKSAT